jgi:hypothetical protein
MCQCRATLSEWAGLFQGSCSLRALACSVFDGSHEAAYAPGFCRVTVTSDSEFSSMLRLWIGHWQTSLRPGARNPRPQVSRPGTTSHAAPAHRRTVRTPDFTFRFQLTSLPRNQISVAKVSKVLAGAGPGDAARPGGRALRATSLHTGAVAQLPVAGIRRLGYARSRSRARCPQCRPGPGPRGQRHPAQGRPRRAVASIRHRYWQKQPASARPVCTLEHARAWHRKLHGYHSNDLTMF